MTDTLSTIVPAILRRRKLILGVLGFILILVLAGTRTMGAGQPATASQCVACHTDAAKLKALTPPDPPASEAGEG